MMNCQFTKNYTRLDPDVMWEKFLFYLALALLCIGLLFAYPADKRQGWFWARTLYILATTCSLLRLVTDITYLLDNEKQRLMYSRSFFGITVAYEVCSFSNIGGVGVRATRHDGRSGHYFTYSILLKLPTEFALNEVWIKVSKDSKDKGQIQLEANDLAKHLQVKLLSSPGEPSLREAERILILRTPIFLKWKKWYQFSNPDGWEGLLFLSCIFFGCLSLL